MLHKYILLIKSTEGNFKLYVLIFLGYNQKVHLKRKTELQYRAGTTILFYCQHAVPIPGPAII